MEGSSLKPRDIEIYELLGKAMAEKHPDSTFEITSDALVLTREASNSNKIICKVSIRKPNSSSPREQDPTKYDLSQEAYVLVFHHFRFDNSTHNRAGSEIDMDKIESFFLNYRTDPIEVHSNKTVEDVHSTMDEIACKDFSDNSCLITIVMSHGHDNDRIEAFDGETYCFERDIVEKCASNRTLDGKPKIFIVQACRGDSIIVADSRKTQSEKSDVLIFHSTYKGLVALRDPENGTFFIQNFFDLLDQNRDEDISHINKHLNRVFTQKEISQTPTMTTTLQKDLMFGDLRKHLHHEHYTSACTLNTTNI